VVGVVEPEITPNNFAYTAFDGASAPLVQLVVSTDDVPPEDLADVRIRIYDAADAFLTEIRTGQGGETDPSIASVHLPGSATPGTLYRARLFRAGYEFPLGPTQLFRVMDPLPVGTQNVFDFEAHLRTPEESTVDELCRLTGRFTDLSLRPVRVTLEFKQIPEFPETVLRSSAGFFGNPTVVAGNMLVRSVKATTNADGRIQVDLPRNGTFEVHIHGLEHPFEITEYITVPDEAGYDLLELIFPYPTRVVVVPVPIASFVGDTDYTAFSVEMSNGQSLTTAEAMNAVIDLTTEDPEIATVVIEDDRIAVTGVSVGTTRLVATRKALFAPRVPSLPALVFTPTTPVEIQVGG
jgi:hypothetical protein